MMRKFFVVTLAVVSTWVVLAPPPAAAQSCNELWYRRNAIFAQAGYCFQTERARAAFGAGCFPPYGRLSPSQQARVNAIQAREAYLGCPR
jgi:hypothetical protein